MALAGQCLARVDQQQYLKQVLSITGSLVTSLGPRTQRRFLPSQLRRLAERAAKDFKPTTMAVCSGHVHRMVRLAPMNAESILALGEEVEASFAEVQAKAAKNFQATETAALNTDTIREMAYTVLPKAATKRKALEASLEMPAMKKFPKAVAISVPTLSQHVPARDVARLCLGVLQSGQDVPITVQKGLIRTLEGCLASIAAADVDRLWTSFSRAETRIVLLNMALSNLRKEIHTDLSWSLFRAAVASDDVSGKKKVLWLWFDVLLHLLVRK